MRPVLAYQLADHASSWTRMVLSPRIRGVCHKKPMVKLRRRSSLGVQVFILYDALGIRWELGGLQHPHTPRPPRIQLPGRISRQAENRYSEGHGNGHLLADGRLPCRLCWTSPPRSTAIARGVLPAGTRTERSYQQAELTPRSSCSRLGRPCALEFRCSLWCLGHCCKSKKMCVAG
jgi:hypothetical protein